LQLDKDDLGGGGDVTRWGCFLTRRETVLKGGRSYLANPGREEQRSVDKAPFKIKNSDLSVRGINPT